MTTETPVRLMPPADVVDEMVKCFHSCDEDVDSYDRVCMKAALKSDAFQSWLNRPSPEARGVREITGEEIWYATQAYKINEWGDLSKPGNVEIMVKSILQSAQLALTAPAQDEGAGVREEALQHLKNGQQQLDADGVMVGVSRQALDELIAAYELTAPAKADDPIQKLLNEQKPLGAEFSKVLFNNLEQLYESDPPSAPAPASGGGGRDQTLHGQGKPGLTRQQIHDGMEVGAPVADNETPSAIHKSDSDKPTIHNAPVRSAEAIIEKLLGSYDRNGVFAQWARDLIKDLHAAGYVINSNAAPSVVGGKDKS